MTIALATVVHDPDGLLRPKLEALLEPLCRVFSAIAVTASEAAPEETLLLLDRHGVAVARDDGPPSVETIGRRRRASLEVALATGAAHVLYSDFDHVMRWLERDRAGMIATLAETRGDEFTVIGRAAPVFEQAPAPLRETERLSNRFYERLTGRAWDLHIALRAMSAGTAALLVEECDEDTIAVDVAWPLFVESRGIPVAYREVELPYESDGWYSSGVSERDRIEADPGAWAFRFELGRQMFDAYERWGGEPA